MLMAKPDIRRTTMDPRTHEQEKADLDNHADQLNPNNDAYYQSRGEDERPDDWEDKNH